MISIVENIDCMIGMAKFPDKFFELAIVDPEYGIDAANMTMGQGSSIDNGRLEKKDWDKTPPSINYFNELFRVSKNQIIWGGNYFGLPKTRCYLIWDKLDYNSDFASAELAWTSFDRVVKTFRHARNTVESRIHPTQKPIKLYKWLLNNYTNKGDKILDTHLGSGSSRIAAYHYEFDFWGYEIDAGYFEAQEKRFKQQTSQLTMFYP